MDGDRTIRIEAPHFVAGLIVNGDIVRMAAPILHYMRLWNTARVEAYCAAKQWTCEAIGG